MQRIEITTAIDAPPEICFDLARDIDFHKSSLRDTHEQAVGGRTSGLIGSGEVVTFRARHFGLYHQHTSKITSFDPPFHFRDEMVRGRFRVFSHDHFFKTDGDTTVMRDVIEFESPYGVLGKACDLLVLKRYLWRLIERRNRELKIEAEKRSQGPV